MALKITNLVIQHKKMAETFLSAMQDSGAAPENFSGVMCPKIGKYVFVWQFDKNKLVGSVLIHNLNIDNFRGRLRAAKESIDWATTDLFTRKETNDTSRESNDVTSVQSGSGEETVRNTDSRPRTNKRRS